MSISFNTHQNHPIIEREQTYFLDKSYITIHSEDRDINKWPNPNHFEVMLPKDLTNVICLRLSDITLPSNIYTFSNNKQNTKFRFKLSPQINISTPDAILEYNALFNAYNTIPYYEVTITEGYYKPFNLAIEIQNKINQTITRTLESLVDGSLNILPECYEYCEFVVKYNPVSHKIEFINGRDSFVLLFNNKIDYDIECGVKDVWCQYMNWGFPYYIGYNKKNYGSLENEGKYFIDSINFQVCPSSDKEEEVVYYSVSDNVVNLLGDNVIYMELDKYNNMDEITPYSHSTNNSLYNDYSGRTNSAFAKILIMCDPFQNVQLTKKDELNYVSSFKVPIQNIRKLKFTFRFHDGRLVDFKNQNFNFTIEAGQLIDEQLRFKIINNQCYE